MSVSLYEPRQATKTNPYIEGVSTLITEDDVTWKNYFYPPTLDPIFISREATQQNTITAQPAKRPEDKRAVPDNETTTRKKSCSYRCTFSFTTR